MWWLAYLFKKNGQWFIEYQSEWVINEFWINTGMMWAQQRIELRWMISKLSAIGSAIHIPVFSLGELATLPYQLRAYGYLMSSWVNKKKRQTCLTSKPHIPSISWSEQDGPFCHDSNAQIWSWYMLLIPFSSLRWDHRFTDWQLCNKGVDGRKFMWSMLVAVGDSLVTEQLVNKCIQRAEIMLIHQWSLPNHWCYDMYRHVKTA